MENERDRFGEKMRLVEQAKEAFLDNLSIKGIMSDPPITVTADTGISEAARLMVEKKVGCLPVVDGKRLIGLVTDTDFLKVLAEGLK